MSTIDAFLSLTLHQWSHFVMFVLFIVLGFIASSKNERTRENGVWVFMLGAFISIMGISSVAV
jgi:uncharacterized membrane protein SirB2